ncbi:MAG: DUF4240 domain-containing protein [Microscillaceae bacterium]|nr:DUF4240 domain-containing protein [Microscillaceae bacterium]
MTESEFWAIIDISLESIAFDAEVDEQIEALVDYLINFSKKDLIGFEIHIRRKLADLYKSEIVELYVIMENDFSIEDNGQVSFDDYVSSDGFLYFRCWLILQGRDLFYDVLQDPETILKYTININEIWGESLLYATDEAYTREHNNEQESEIKDEVFKSHPEIDYDCGDFELDRDPEIDYLQDKYPDLVREIIRLKK